VADVRRDDVEAFLVERSEAGMRPATLSQRFRSLQQFFKWLAAEGEIRRNPMAGIRPPHVPETPPPVRRGSVGA
jgi:integrase/recombinase XerC